MEITITETSPKDMLIFFKGKLDTMNARQVSADLEPVMDILSTTPKNITLDFSDLTYIASAGLRIILMLHKAINNQGATFIIKGMRPDVYEVFEVTGLTGSIIIK